VRPKFSVRSTNIYSFIRHPFLAPRTDSEIIAEVTGLSDHSDSEHSEEQREAKSAPPSFSDIISAFAIWKGCLCTRQTSEADERCLSQIRLLYEAGGTRRKQTALDSLIFYLSHKSVYTPQLFFNCTAFYAMMSFKCDCVITVFKNLCSF
jgi:hypothetical protein